MIYHHFDFLNWRSIANLRSVEKYLKDRITREFKRKYTPQIIESIKINLSLFDDISYKGIYNIKITDSGFKFVYVVNTFHNVTFIEDPVHKLRNDAKSASGRQLRKSIPEKIAELMCQRWNCRINITENRSNRILMNASSLSIPGFIALHKF